MLRKVVFAVLVMLLALSGCVYYNTFFNAERYFKEAQEMPLKDNGDPSANAVQDYNKTIKKCGIVLTDYKDSKYADDALYLMARCFFYIGRNYTQAIKHFEELVEFYPESEFIPEAKLYIARANYEFTRKELAFQQLQEFLQNNQYKEQHPKALRLLADYHLAEKNFVDADYYLNRIIEKYPKSEEYANAFFLQGKAQYEAGNYEKSNEVFFALLKSRVPRNLKFDARYYISLNYIMLGDFEEAEKYSLKLLKDEYREEYISKIQLLKARSLAGNGHYNEAIKIYETIINDNPRSLLSAEAAYHMGELYFNTLHDYENAITNFNKVKQENSKTPYIEESLTKSAVASQIIQFNNPDSDLAVEDLVLQQFKLAEFYIEYLNMPDSALIVYDHITNQKNAFITRLDTLKSHLKANEDSLRIVELIETELQNSAASDSTENEIKTELSDTKTDSLKLTEFSSIDTLDISTVNDSLLISQDIISDTLSVVYDESLADSLEEKTILEAKQWTLSEIGSEKQRLQNSINELNQQVTRNEQDIQKYENEFIPFAKFIKLWLFKIVLNDSLRMQEEFADIQENFPDNKYAYAANLMLQNKDIQITTEKDIAENNDYETAIKDFFTKPDSTKLLLQEIVADTTHSFYLKANYSLGYLNHFLLSDSLEAKKCFDTILAQKSNNDYLPAVQKIYNGNQFSTVERLPALIELEEKEAAEEENATAEEQTNQYEEKQDKTSISHEDEKKKDTQKEDPGNDKQENMIWNNEPTKEEFPNTSIEEEHPKTYEDEVDDNIEPADNRDTEEQIAPHQEESTDESKVEEKSSEELKGQDKSAEEETNQDESSKEEKDKQNESSKKKDDNKIVEESKQDSTKTKNKEKSSSGEEQSEETQHTNNNTES